MVVTSREEDAGLPECGEKMEGGSGRERKAEAKAEAERKRQRRRTRRWALVRRSKVLADCGIVALARITAPAVGFHCLLSPTSHNRQYSSGSTGTNKYRHQST